VLRRNDDAEWLPERASRTGNQSEPSASGGSRSGTVSIVNPLHIPSRDRKGADRCWRSNRFLTGAARFHQTPYDSPLESPREMCYRYTRTPVPEVLLCAYG